MHISPRAKVRTTLDAVAAVRLAPQPSPVEELTRLRALLGGGPRLLVKRDDALSFAFGGNKVRKAEIVAAEAVAAGADTLLTVGGVQSNHARVTAAVAARLGLRCVLVANGSRPPVPTANLLLDTLLGARIEYVEAPEDREPAMHDIAAHLRRQGARPFVIPLGASTPSGAIGFVRAVGELLEQIDPPDLIVHSTSSGGTQAGLVAGCRLFGAGTRVLGVSADQPAAVLSAQVGSLVDAVLHRLGHAAPAAPPQIEVDDDFVGAGYGIPTTESAEAIELAARSEALFLDPTYSAKAMAGLIAYVRAGRFREDEVVLFWHTGGQVTLFA